MKTRNSDSSSQYQDHTAADSERKEARYAGPKFHTTSPSPKTLPMPVFSQNQDHSHASLSTSLPAITIFSIEKSKRNDKEGPSSFSSDSEERSRQRNMPSLKNSTAYSQLFGPGTDHRPDNLRHTRRSRASTMTRVENAKHDSKQKFNNTPTTSLIPIHETFSTDRDKVGTITILPKGMTLNSIKDQGQVLKKPKTSPKKKRTARNHDPKRRLSDPGTSLHNMSCDLKQILRIVDAPAS